MTDDEVIALARRHYYSQGDTNLVDFKLCYGLDPHQCQPLYAAAPPATPAPVDEEAAVTPEQWATVRARLPPTPCTHQNWRPVVDGRKCMDCGEILL